ncbi:hypothetical protein Tco_0390442, partial [Tanacetum coccineum]
EGDLKKFSDIGAWYAIKDYAQYDKKCSNPTSVIFDETIANLNAQIVVDDMVRVQVPRCMALLDYDEHVDSLSTMDNEVGVTSPEITTQTLPSFEEYTPPVTYPEEVEKTLGTLIEVEPFNKTKLEEIGLNCNHNTPLSSKEVPSFDGPEPQPLLNSPSLDMFDDDWGLESKEVSPLGEKLSLFDRPNEVERGRILEAHRLESILQQQISQRMAPSHHDAAKSKGLEATSVVSESRFSVSKTPTTTNKRMLKAYKWQSSTAKKFMGTVRFGNDHFAAITGYGDYVQGNLTICHVYYVEGLMTALAEHIIVAGSEHRPPMLEKSMYDSWASRIRLFIKWKKHGRMMLDSIDNGPLVYPTVKENGQTRPKKDSELTEAQQLQDDCDVQATK